APMAWTVAFALVGALLFALVLAPVLASYLLRADTREWDNPVLTALTGRYRRGLSWCLQHRATTLGAAAGVLALTLLLVRSGVAGSESLPHLDEGAIWVRGTLPASTGPTEGERLMAQARLVLAAFPEVTQVVSQVGRPDDGSDATGFFNT